MLRPTVIKVTPEKDYLLLLEFNNAEKKEFDVKPMILMQKHSLHKKSLFPLLMLLALTLTAATLFSSCIFENKNVAVQNHNLEETEPGNTPSSFTQEQNKTSESIIVFGKITINGAVPQDIPAQNGQTQNDGATSDRAAIPTYVPSEVEYFATATNEAGTKTVSGTFDNDEEPTTFGIPLSPGQNWTITCGLKKLDSNGTPGTVLFTKTSDETVDPATLAAGTVLEFFPLPDVSGAADSTGEIDLSMTIDSSISEVQLSCISTNHANWPFTAAAITTGSTTNTAKIQTDSTNPTVRSGAYDVIINFYQTGITDPVYSTTQTINVCKGLKTTKWISSVGETPGEIYEESPIDSDGNFVVNAAKLASFINTDIYVGTVPGGAAPSDTNSGTHASPFLTFKRAISYIEAIATAENADPTLEYKIYITGEVNSTPVDETPPELASALDGKASKIIIRGRGTNRNDNVITNPNTDGRSRVLTITTTVPIEIYNLTIKNGNTNNFSVNDNNGSGGGLRIEGDGLDVTLTNCVIRDCKAKGGGGAIYVRNDTSTSTLPTVKLNNCLIGGELSAATSIQVTNSGSNKSEGNGGGIGIHYGKAVLLNTRVIGNIVANNGGGIYCEYGILEINGGQVNYNSAGGGGGLAFYSATIVINDCLIGKTCTDSDTAATDQTDCGNCALSPGGEGHIPGGGGGIKIQGGSLTTTRGFKVCKNYSVKEGGGIYSAGSGEVVFLKNSILNKNKSTEAGDAIYVYSGKFTFKSGEMKGNTSAAADSATIYVKNGSTFNFKGGTISNNNKRAFANYGVLNVSGGTISGHTAERGGAIYNDGSLNISGGLITGNTAASNGGAIYVNSEHDGITPSFTMTGGTISGNHALSYGGGIFNGSPATISGGEISGNYITGTSSCGGGGIATFLNLTIEKDAYIPAGANGKNDIYLYDSGDNVTKFYVEVDESLTRHNSTDKIMLLPAAYAENRPMISLAADSTAELSDEYLKFGVTKDAAQPGVNWSVDIEGKLKRTIPLYSLTASAASYDGTTVVSGSPVFKTSRNLGTIKSLIVRDHEETQGEYETYCTYGGSAPNATYGVGELYPAYNVSWYDAIVYCNLLSMHTNGGNLSPVYSVGGETDPAKWSGIVKVTENSITRYCAPADCDWYVVIDDTKNGWRLPYEAEWEYLWRGGNLDNSSQHTYSGGDTPGTLAWYEENALGKTHVVKTKIPNSLNLYDMSGNVWEWMNDWHLYPIPETAPITGVSYQTSEDKKHVTRGGGFGSGNNGLTASGARGTSASNYRWYDMGFRIVRNAEETTDAYPRAVPAYIGSKGPDEVREVGDIIFTDGSAEPYTEGLNLTDAQKAAAIAVIFYKGNGLNKEGDTSTRTLGLGLIQKAGLPWARQASGDQPAAMAIGLDITAIQGNLSSGDKYGKDNLSDISAFLNAGGYTDDTTTLSNYPVFNYAANYKDEKLGSETTSRLAGTTFEDEWYVPTMQELNEIYKKKGFINGILGLCGGTQMTASYWSSNQHSTYKSNANNLAFGNGSMTPNGTGMTNGYQMNTRPIREF